MARPLRIIATRHEPAEGRPAVSRVELDAPPVAVVPWVDSLMGLWWHRAGGYPVGRIFGTPLQ